MKSSPDAKASRRTCVGCGRDFEQDRLVRFVLSPEATVELDYGRRLPGRGAYLFPNRTCFEKAAKGKGFDRAFKRSDYRFNPDVLWERLRRVNRERLMEGIRLAMKAGSVVSGGNNVEAGLKKKELLLLLMAEDVADNSLKRFGDSARFQGLPFVRALRREELGRVLGKDQRAVLAVTEAAFKRRLLRDGAIYDAIANRIECQGKR